MVFYKTRHNLLIYEYSMSYTFRIISQYILKNLNKVFSFSFSFLFVEELASGLPLAGLNYNIIFYFPKNKDLGIYKKALNFLWGRIRFIKVSHPLPNLPYHVIETPL